MPNIKPAIASICLLLALLLPVQSVAVTPNIALPEQLGKIVFQSPIAEKRRVYILLNSHRSAQDGANGARTLQAQMETYRIGEWQISHGLLNLLLPEGFFGRWRNKIVPTENLLAPAELRKQLNDTSRFVNAELLLHENFGIGLQQIEDRQLYRQIRAQLSLASQTENRTSNQVAQQLKYLQKRRTAMIMQNIPSAIDTAFQQEKGVPQAAMLTIGLAHLEELLLCLENGEISIAGQQSFPALHNGLELLKEKVSVTVIVPPSLLDLLPEKYRAKA